MKDKIKARITYLEERIATLDERDDIVDYNANDKSLPIGAHISYGLRVGELQAITLELMFLEELIKLEEGNHGSSNN